MLFFATLLIGLLGFGYAAYLDLKTTEFPDWIPYVIILSSLASRAGAVLLGSPITLVYSALTTGLLFLGFGLLLYHLRQWGDGDAWLLGALGFLLPDSAVVPATALAIPFPLTLLINFFLLSFVFIVVYALAIGAHQKVYGAFLHTLKKERRSTSLILVVFLAASYSLLWYASSVGLPFRPGTFLFPLSIIPLLLFLKYAVFIEARLFRRRIPASQLRPGDVPASAHWRVLSPHQYRALKRSSRSIQIKEGVRLAPAFLLAFLATLLFGNMMGFFLIL